MLADEKLHVVPLERFAPSGRLLSFSQLRGFRPPGIDVDPFAAGNVGLAAGERSGNPIKRGETQYLFTLFGTT